MEKLLNLKYVPSAEEKKMTVLRSSCSPYRLAVMGNPVEHSKSPWIHNEFAKQFDLTIDYIKIQPKLDEFEQEVEQFKASGGYGFNITIPFKQRAFNLSTECSQRAKIAKAVNTLVYKSGTDIYGDNTDGIGLIRDITQHFKYTIKNKSILLLGAGGAVRGILYPLLCESPSLITIANRTIEKATQLTKDFQDFGEIQSCGLSSLAGQQYDLVIDGTGFSNEEMAIPDNLRLSAESFCYDLKYSSTPTPFMKWAKDRKSSIVADGLGMLVEQAAEAFFIWTGEKPATSPVLEKALRIFYAH
jgi:shikimate dehydrogenase